MKKISIKRKNRLLVVGIIVGFILLLVICFSLFFAKEGIDENNHDSESTPSESSQNYKDSDAGKSSGKKTSKEELRLVKMADVLSGKYGIDDVNFKTDKGFLAVRKDGITRVDGTLIANKSFSLPEDYNPGDFTEETKTGFDEMLTAAGEEGIEIFVVSGFRSYDLQNTLYNSYSAQEGKEEADRYSARPGFSEHQSGMAMDLNDVNYDFGETKEGKWLNDNAWKYGFILRYVNGKEEDTGYKFEPWHYRFVGKELAKKLYNKGNWITMEEYFGIPSQYAK